MTNQENGPSEYRQMHEEILKLSSENLSLKLRLEALIESILPALQVHKTPRELVAENLELKKERTRLYSVLKDLHETTCPYKPFSTIPSYEEPENIPKCTCSNQNKTRYWATQDFLHRGEITKLQAENTVLLSRIERMEGALKEAVRVFEILPNRPVLGSEAEALIFASMWNQCKKAVLLPPIPALEIARAKEAVVEAAKNWLQAGVCDEKEIRLLSEVIANLKRIQDGN